MKYTIKQKSNREGKKNSWGVIIIINNGHELNNSNILEWDLRFAYGREHAGWKIEREN